MDERDVSSARLRLGCCLLVGIVVGVGVGMLVHPALGVVSGLGTFAASFVIWSLMVVWPMTAEETQRHVLREDTGTVAIEAVIAVIALGSLGGISSVMIIEHTTRHAADRDVAAAVALAAVFAMWAMLHTMYATRYARDFYAHPPGGIDFNGDGPPCYRDFCYFSFNLGMTYQVSDTSVSTTELRATVLRHCLMSYVFGTVILAATISLVAGIALGGS